MVATLTAAGLMFSHVLPTQRQLAWHEVELYTLIHFGPNTFTGKEWGLGDEDPNIFNPTQFDPGQWARAIKRGGFKGLIMVAKHHDGFSLWPSRWSPHTVASSKWRDGKGDVIREVSEACRKEGLLFGVYLSPWDRHHPRYGQGEAYNEAYRRQMEELLTEYGPLFEFWFDGANGEGPNGRRQVYDWPSFWEKVRERQPQAVMFSDIGPDIRWVGNETGEADETNWNTYTIGKLQPGNSEAPRLNPIGMEDGDVWLPAECDVPLRPGWFWRESEDEKVKPLSWMIETYFKSVGRGASFNLGLAPDRRGLLHKNDVNRLTAFGKWLKASFRTDLLKGAQGPVAAMDGKMDTWIKGGQAELTLKKPALANAVLLQENIARGQRIRSFKIELLGADGQWKEAAQGTTIGWKRILRFPPTEVTALRVKVLSSKGEPQVSRISLYRVLTADEIKGG
jgi:alpha-L-fucosidase